MLEQSYIQQQEAPLILIADDSQMVCLILEFTLRRAGYNVRSFADGFSMLRWLHDGGPVPRLIFLDLIMPRMDGYQVARWLRKQPTFDNTKLVMHSRCNGILERLKGRLAGVQAWISKPSTTQEILYMAWRYCMEVSPKKCEERRTS
ncbi:response regulator [Ktedonosporobacter rubrisoli]|nr:response regulator [Ktedonosporobacter rubrisoli]